MKTKTNKQPLEHKNSGSLETAFKVGRNYFIRAVTMYYTGRLIAMNANELIFDQCSWIPDTGFFSEALRDGKFSEVEPFPDGEVIILRNAIVDATNWTHPLPRERE